MDSYKFEINIPTCWYIGLRFVYGDVVSSTGRRTFWTGKAIWPCWPETASWKLVRHLFSFGCCRVSQFSSFFNTVTLLFLVHTPLTNLAAGFWIDSSCFMRVDVGDPTQMNKIPKLNAQEFCTTLYLFLMWVGHWYNFLLRKPRV